MLKGKVVRTLVISGVEYRTKAWCLMDREKSWSANAEEGCKGGIRNCKKWSVDHWSAAKSLHEFYQGLV